MIEKVLRDYLTLNLSVPVYLELPETLPERFVVFDRTGSGKNNGMSTATFAVKSCGKSLEAAIDLHELVARHMERMPYMVQCVSKVRLSTAYNFTDTKTKIRRYQAVYTITYKE